MPLATASALPDDVDFKVIKSRFGYPERYNQGQSLCLEWTTDLGDDTVIYPVGPDWEMNREGTKITHPKGWNGPFPTTAYGKLVDRINSLQGDNGKSLGDQLEAKFGKEAAVTSTTFEGLRFHGARELSETNPAKIKKLEAGGFDNPERFMPVAYLGTEDKPEFTLNPLIKKEAVAVALVSDTYATYANNLMEQDFYTGADAETQGAVDTEEFYNVARG